MNRATHTQNIQSVTYLNLGLISVGFPVGCRFCGCRRCLLGHLLYGLPGGLVFHLDGSAIFRQLLDLDFGLGGAPVLLGAGLDVVGLLGVTDTHGCGCAGVFGFVEVLECAASQLCE